MHYRPKAVNIGHGQLMAKQNLSIIKGLLKFAEVSTMAYLISMVLPYIYEEFRPPPFS